MNRYKAKIEYRDKIEKYILLVLENGHWVKHGICQNAITLWETKEDVLEFIEQSGNYEIVED